ncbi:MAG: exodeoxyribonuclease VII small subunit [Lachnospiraceae bacterium]|nr:exodeoxyribonuclease VII small subunit [Lachnospiraceae bacterium]
MAKNQEMEAKEEFNVDEELKHLEEINRKLGENGITLNEAIKLYNEGTKLAVKCQEHLTGVEKELKIISE